ncbi:TrkH family potassium uptake protein [Jhaorihella thermophila]|uniref:Trk system potassium uptake protein TrkH n=1 Tax=Jhaorihella thermophila TaxID=488547 RepID=A0A1H5S568_9RHOB|nr:potassium transporter TrkG [Jhaorihella thermophila]SEF44957.1 trk system potassium uptake protein TrkH [Jhaorihella thermophila]
MSRIGKYDDAAWMPLALQVWGVFSLAMWLPAAHALIRNNHAVSRSFFYSGLLGVICVAMIALALRGRRSRRGALGQLLVLFAVFAALPAFLAIPLHDAMRTTSFVNAYFDMVSAITTTGANLFDDPARLDASIHLWRAEVGWLGGLVMWIAAGAILAPLSLGGFEITARGQPGRSSDNAAAIARADPMRRVVRTTVVLTPVYAGLTVVVWVLLMVAGESALTGLSHAMSVMATSGISPVGGLSGSASGVTGEAILFLFMFFALSRLTFSSDTANRGYARLDKDPEFRIGLMIVVGVPALLFLRHWLATLNIATASQGGAEPLQALWGAVFTVLSFLTTTGFVSADWGAAQSWSGMGTPGLILMGLALVGGGVATTAGGVKLLRVYVLYLSSARELERLVHPHSVGGGDPSHRRFRRDGAFIAWVFFMLFALSLSLVTTVLAALGVGFEQSVVMAVATLSTTGPLIEVAMDTPVRLIELGAGAKAVLCAAMVLGRLETLAIVALLTPDLWRN